MSFLVAGVLILLVSSSGSAFAQVSGVVRGTVTDRDTGQPLVGAQVIVDGTNLGNVTNEDGFYFINNIPVGIQQVVAQYLGYQTLGREERILAGQTMTADFALSSEVIAVDQVIEVVLEREPLVVRDNTISKTRFTAEDTRSLPVGSVEGVVELAPGVYQGQGGFIVRGGRGTESATYVDGALVTDFMNQLNQTEISNFAVEEVDVVTGGFNAEFGHAQSGVINIVTREGGQDFNGNVRFTTDELEVEQSYGFNNLQASLGGPIIPDMVTFFGSFEATGAEDFSPAAAGFNPAVGRENSSGSTEELLPGNRGDRTLGQVKLSAFLPAEAKVTTTYLFSRDQFENYNDQYSLSQYISGATRTKTHDIILGYDQQIFQTAVRNLNLQVRGNYHATTDHAGIALTPETAGILRERLGDACTQCDVTEDSFDEDFLNWRFEDIKFFFEDSTTGSVGNLPNTSRRDPDPVFGQPNMWIQDGFNDSFAHQHERRYGIRVDLDSQLNRVHRAKVGAEWNWVNFFVRNGLLLENTFADVYDVDPRVGAAYVQDRLDFGDLVIDLGLRWDHFDPNVMFPVLPGIVSCEISPFLDANGDVDVTQCRSEGAEIQGTEPNNEFSPRVGVAHPITDETQVRLSYGKFYQLPRLQDFYSSFVTDINAAGGNNNITYGNPNLDFVETTSFEAGITNLISEDLVVDLVAYNRDRRGAIRLDVFQSQTIDPTVNERRIFVNGDNGNVKGFDLSLHKRYSNYFSTDLAWSLQWARGTSSSPTAWATGDGFGRLFNPLFPGRLLTPPTELQPEEFDRLHNINWQFVLRFPTDFREGTALGTVFRDFAASVIYNAQSGVPFTRRIPEGQGEAAEDLGASRRPWIHSGDVRLSKGFPLTDGLDFSVFALVLNFLDIENVTRVNPTTGLADLTGFEDQLSVAPTISTAFKVAGAPGAAEFPVVIDEHIQEEFRAAFRNQDLNGDGTITLAESRATLIDALNGSGFGAGYIFGDVPANYGAPREIRFGAEIRF